MASELGGLMKKLMITFLIPAVFLCILSVSDSVFAQSKSQQYLGKPEMCVDVSRIKETRIIDDQTILFIMKGGQRYLNRLPVKCPGLMLSNGFGYATSIDKLCMQDSIKVLSKGSAIGSTCPLGEFVPFKADMSDSAAEKLLKGGLLNELVSEGAFKEIGSSKK